MSITLTHSLPACPTRLGAETLAPGTATVFRILAKIAADIPRPGSPLLAHTKSTEDLCRGRLLCESKLVGSLLKSSSCTSSAGWKGAEGRVEEAFADFCRAQLLDWPSLRTTMQLKGRFQMEAYW